MSTRHSLLRLDFGYQALMCGRFTQWRELVDLYRLTQPGRNLQPHYNIAPTTEIDVLRLRDGAYEIVSMRWGLVPSWWKKSLKDVPATFNARSDTVAEKPMFRSAFERSRCIIPASGYYEWQTVKGAKQPYYFSAANGGVLSIAGLWDQWNDIQTGEPLVSCTMIVTEANGFAGRVQTLHRQWLSPNSPLRRAILATENIDTTDLPNHLDRGVVPSARTLFHRASDMGGTHVLKLAETDDLPLSADVNVPTAPIWCAKANDYGFLQGRQCLKTFTPW